jgi:hypothetical protein
MLRFEDCLFGLGLFAGLGAFPLSFGGGYLGLINVQLMLKGFCEVLVIVQLVCCVSVLCYLVFEFTCLALGVNCIVGGKTRFKQALWRWR